MSVEQCCGRAEYHCGQHHHVVPVLAVLCAEKRRAELEAVA